MNTRLIPFLPIGLLLAAASCSSQGGSDPKHDAAPAGVVRGRAAMITETFSVEALDTTHRTVTLKGPEGKTATFLVGDEIKRFNEVHVGDSLVVQYHVGVMAELREPTAEEKAMPILIQEGVSRAPSDVPPTGALTRSVRVVTTIDALDKQAQTVTLKGPLQGTVTTKVEDAAVFAGLKVGQPVVATFGEQLVLAVEPGSKK